MIEIKNSLDWAKTESELRKLGNMLPMFEADIKRIINHVGSMVRELSQLEVEARNTRSRSMVARCESKAAKINEELKMAQKFHLMAMLTK
jgi:regulator of replication initiation timing